MAIATHKCARAECLFHCPSKNKFCSYECLQLSRPRLVKPPTVPRETVAQKKEQERVRLEDRLLADVRDFIKQHPNRIGKLAPVATKKTSASSHEMMLLFSDTHYPEVVDKETAMGLEYNADIAASRIARVRDVTMRYKDLRKSAFPIHKLTVAILGDMLSGDIHEELEVTNQFPMAESLVKLAYLIHDMLSSLSKEFPNVEAIFMPGNHPRLTKKPRHKNKWNNWDYVLGHFVAALAGQAYTVQVPKDIVYVHKIFDHRIGMVHGDGVKSASFAGIPWYGMKSRRDAIQSLLRHLGQPGIDYLVMGHFHQLLYWQGTDCDLIINGAVKGGDEYSIDTRHASTDPVQALLTFHEHHGLTDLSRINLSHI